MFIRNINIQAIIDEYGYISFSKQEGSMESINNKYPCLLLSYVIF